MGTVRAPIRAEIRIDNVLHLAGVDGGDPNKLIRSQSFSLRQIAGCYFRYQTLSRKIDGTPVKYALKGTGMGNPYLAAAAVVRTFVKAFEVSLSDDYRTVWTPKIITVEKRITASFPDSFSDNPLAPVGSPQISVRSAVALPGLAITRSYIAATVEQKSFRHEDIKGIPEGRDPFIDRAKRGLRKYEKSIRFRTPKKLSVSGVIEAFGSDRCLSGGIPTFMAENLLKGLRKPVSSVSTMETIRNKHGTQRHRYAVEQAQLASAGLMLYLPGDGKHKKRYATTYYGFMLLKHWADTRKEFKPYFDAYTRKGDEGRLATNEMLERL